MKLAIMQPYFLPYLGYFSLIRSVDKFIFYDDVNYINKSYINRNSIFLNGASHNFTLELNGASQNKLINQISVGSNKQKLFKTIKQAYSKSAFYDDFIPVLDDIFKFEDDNLASFVSNSLTLISNYLKIDTDFCLSSEIEKDLCLKGQDKIIEINKKIGSSVYINSIGGQSLYNKECFLSNNIDLKFLKWISKQYKQPSGFFVSNLSIVDAIFNVGAEQTNLLISEYELL